MFSTVRLNNYRILIWSLSIVGFIYLLYYNKSLLWVTLGVYCVQQLIGFNAYLHRFIAHRTYKTYKPIEFMMAILSVPCLIGSPISLAWVHRAHHKYSDKPKDPHSPHLMGQIRAFFCLHYLDTEGVRVSMKDVVRDPIAHWVNEYYFYLHAVIALIWFTIGGLDLLIAAYIIPATLHTIAVGYVLGIFAHQWGYRNFETKEYSKNSLITHILSVGDGWHNNHHAHPGKYSFQHKWWEFDPTAWYIWLIKKRS